MKKQLFVLLFLTYSSSQFAHQPGTNRTGNEQIIVTAAFTSNQLQAAETYYVDGNRGSDTNGQGSKGNPWMTIQKAASEMVAGDTCIIRGGVYFETVTPVNSGTRDSVITYKGYPGETVTISGADIITGWEKYSGSIYRAPMSWTLGKENQVFVNGSMAYLARWPDVVNPNDPFDFNNLATAKKGSSDGHVFDDALPLKPDNYWNNCIIWGNFGAKWSSYAAKITSSKGQNVYFSQPSGMKGWYGAPYECPSWGTFLATNKEAYFISGKFELLDTENEWYYDEADKNLYIWVKGGGNPGTSVQAKRRGTVINLDNKSFITIQGVSIFGASISMQNSTSCILDGINAKYITHTTMESMSSRPSLISGTNGIMISGNQNIVRNCIIRYSAANGISVGGSNNEIDNNDIQYCDYMNFYAYGISLGGSGNIITRNKVFYTGNVGIHGEGLKTGNDDGAFVFYNDVGYTSQFADDRGGIEGCNFEVAYNWVHDIGRGQAIGLTPAIYTDLAQDYATYHHNLAWNITGIDPMFRINNTGNKNGNVGIFIINNTSFNTPGSSLSTGSDMWTATNNYRNESSGNFVNASENDFRLSSGATAINAGDYFLTPYNLTYGSKGSPDLGAYEYGADDARSNWKAGLNSTIYYLGNGKWVSPGKEK